MFTQTSEYALRVIVFLAKQDGQAVTTRQIAAGTRVPIGYLAKVMQGLGRAGMVDSQRGLHGGFVLSHDPARLTVHDVIQSVDPMPRIHRCPLGLKSHGANLCPLHRRLDDAMAMVEKAFRESSIADLLAEPTASSPLCETPELRSALKQTNGSAKALKAPAELTVSARRPRRRAKT